MQAHELKALGAKRKQRKRVGRGTASGTGKTCGRGSNGQGSRSGSFGSTLFAGGQTPLFRRLPKRGFTSHVRKPSVINLSDLNRFDDGNTVNMETLVSSGLVRKRERAVKVLGRGVLEKKLTVVVSAFSSSAVEAIEKAGGKVEIG